MRLSNSPTPVGQNIESELWPEGPVRTEKKLSVISLQLSAVSFQRSARGLPGGKGGKNRLAGRPHPWKGSCKAEKFMKISRLSGFRVDFMNRAQNMAIENKPLISLVWGEMGEKKGAPK